MWGLNFFRKKEDENGVSDRELNIKFKQFALKNIMKFKHVSNRKECSLMIQVLCKQIEEYKKKYDYVPPQAYLLLNKFVLMEQEL